MIDRPSSASAAHARQFAGFVVVGAGGFLVDASALALFMQGFGLDAYSGRVGSYLVAATFTWILNRRFTFKSGRGGLFRQWLAYISAGALGGAANFAVYSAVIAIGAHLGFRWPDALPYLGVAFGSGVALMINFTLARKLVFR